MVSGWSTIRHCKMGPWSRTLGLLALILLNHQSSASSHWRNHTKADLLDELFVVRGYDKRVRPGEDYGEPSVVAVSFYINSISHIDEVNSNFQVELYFRTKFWDRRLIHNYTDGVVSLGQAVTNLMWHPDIYFENEEDAHEHFFNTHNTGYWLWPNGTIAQSTRVSAKFACEMDMREYPMDTQTCTITVLSYSQGRSELDLKWFDGDSPVQLSSDISIPEFDIIGNNFTHRDVTYTLGGDYRLLHFNLILRRQFGLYFVNTYSPSILVVVMSWVTFWIEAQNTTPRVSIGLLTVLTMSTQTSTTLTSLPRVTYIKAMDIWMITCLLYVFIGFLETALITVLYFSAPDGATVAPQAPPLNTKENDLVKPYKPADPSLASQVDIKKTPPTSRNKHKWVIYIDTAFRVGTPCTFFIFCLVYFVHYAT